MRATVQAIRKGGSAGAFGDVGGACGPGGGVCGPSAGVCGASGAVCGACACVCSGGGCARALSEATPTMVKAIALQHIVVCGFLTPL